MLLTSFSVLGVGVAGLVAEVLGLALVFAAGAAGVAFEDHEGLARVGRVSERVRIAEGEAGVLGLVLVHLAVRLQQLGVLEAVEGDAVLVGVDLAQRLGNGGVRGDSAAAGVPLGNVVERGGRVEHVDLVALHQAGGTGPFGVADGGAVQRRRGRRSSTCPWPDRRWSCGRSSRCGRSSGAGRSRSRRCGLPRGRR